MAGPITTGTHPKALWPGIRAWFGVSYDEHAPEYPDLFDEETSDKAYEEDVGLVPFGLLPVKPEGSGINYDSESQDYTVRYLHIAYAGGYVVTYEELQDDLYEIVSKRRARRLAFSARQTMENIGANVYNNAFSTFKSGDGVTVVNTAHPTLFGNQSNQLSTAADFSEAAAEDLVVQIMQATDARGKKVNLMPQSLHIPVQLVFEANRVYKSVLQNDTANNAVNVLRALNVFPKGIKPNHYFTSATAWFVRTNADYGMRWYWREKPIFDQDNDFDTKNAKAACYFRVSCGVSDWRAIFATPGV